MKNLILIMLLSALTSGTIQAQDWANLKRFQTENSELEIPKPNEHRIVFMGNSITEGWKNIRPNFFANKPNETFEKRL